MFGTVNKYFAERNYGFISGEDRNMYFVHKSNLDGEHIEPGYYVSFKPFQTDRSDYNAKNVIVVDSVPYAALMEWEIEIDD